MKKKWMLLPNKWGDKGISDIEEFIREWRPELGEKIGKTDLVTDMDLESTLGHSIETGGWLEKLEINRVEWDKAPVNTRIRRRVWVGLEIEIAIDSPLDKVKGKKILIKKYIFTNIQASSWRQTFVALVPRIVS